MLKTIQKSRAILLILYLALASVVSVCLFLGKAEVGDSGVFKLVGLQPAAAQFARPQDAGRQVYERLPDLPRENQYVSKETGQVVSDDTLVSRLIRYHIYVKKRLPNFRFDWKLTMADYLGAHEYLVDSQYPGSNNLKTNPMESDRAAIQKLNRAQRDALVNVLVSILGGDRAPASTPSPSASPSPSPSTTPNPSATPSLPKPGDAQLLLP